MLSEPNRLARLVRDVLRLARCVVTLEPGTRAPLWTRGSSLPGLGQVGGFCVGQDCLGMGRFAQLQDAAYPSNM